MLKLTDNPTPLLPGMSRPSDAAGVWWVAHTKPRTEKALAFDLTSRAVPYYLPMARRTQVSGGRRRTTLIPLFPSYLFFCCDTDQARLSVLSTQRVVHTIRVETQATFVSELESVYTALSANGDLNVYPHVAVGRRCRVARGPMRGVEGIVIQDRDVTRIILQVSMIGCGAALEINASDLEDGS